MPATPTYVSLAQVTLAAAAASVTLPVPSGFRDVVLVITGTATSAQGVLATHNGDTTAANYSSVNMYGNGSTTTSQTSAAANIGSIYTVQSQITVQFLDVSATDKHKTALSRSDQAGTDTYALARRWANTAAITSITLSASNFNIGCTFNLYGIEA